MRGKQDVVMENPISGEVQSQESCYGARFRRQADRCVPRWSPSEEEKGEEGGGRLNDHLGAALSTRSGGTTRVAIVSEISERKRERRQKLQLQVADSVADMTAATVTMAARRRRRS